MLTIRDSFHVRGICQQLHETNLAVVPLDVQLSRTKSAILVVSGRRSTASMDGKSRQIMQCTSYVVIQRRAESRERMSMAWWSEAGSGEERGREKVTSLMSG